MASQSQPSTKYTWISCIRRENGSPEPRETQAETSEPKRVVVGARGALESHAKMSENNLASIPLNWKNLLVKTHDHRVGVRKHLQNTQQKSAQGTISPTFVSPRLLGPQLVPGDDFAGDLHESAMRLLGSESMRLIKFRDMKHRHLVISSHISYQLAFLVTLIHAWTNISNIQHSNLPFVLSIQKSLIGLHAKSTVFLMNLFDKSVALFEQFSHPALCTLQQRLIGVLPGRQTPGILVHLSMARKGHLKQMQVI